VASTMEGGVLVEDNYFENTPDPFHVGEGSSDPGSLVARVNEFVNSGEGQQSGSVSDPSTATPSTRPPRSPRSCRAARASAGSEDLTADQVLDGMRDYVVEPRSAAVTSRISRARAAAEGLPGSAA
jgi:hypothetical protein